MGCPDGSTVREGFNVIATSADARPENDIFIEFSFVTMIISVITVRLGGSAIFYCICGATILGAYIGLVAAGLAEPIRFGLLSARADGEKSTEQKIADMIRQNSNVGAVIGFCLAIVSSVAITTYWTKIEYLRNCSWKGVWKWIYNACFQ